MTCQDICECLVSYVLVHDEEGEECEAKRTTPNSPLVTCIVALKLFCTACPELLLPHLESLEPYLKSQVSIPNFNWIGMTISRPLTLLA